MLDTMRNRYDRRAKSVFVAVFVVFAASIEVEAKELPLPSPVKGLELAQKFCTGCHVVESSASTTVPAGVPTFRGIANRPGQTGQHIKDVLIQPHPPMPDIHLSAPEIQNIIAYLETLRTDKSAPPLLPPANPVNKPVYPEPS